MNEAINIFIGFALVSTEVGGTDFEMHRLIQVSTIAWLRYLGDLEEHKEVAVDSLAKCYPCPRIAGSMAAGGYYGRRPKLRARSISRGLSPISS